MTPDVSPVKDSSFCTGSQSLSTASSLQYLRRLRPFGSGCSPASPFQNILCFPFYANFKTIAKIIFFIQPTLRCIGGLPKQKPPCQHNTYLTTWLLFYPILFVEISRELDEVVHAVGYIHLFF